MDSLLWNQSVNTYLPLKMLFRVTKRSSLVLNRVEKRRVFVLTQGLKAHSARHTSSQTSLECPCPPPPPHPPRNIKTPQSRQQFKKAHKMSSDPASPVIC